MEQDTKPALSSLSPTSGAVRHSAVKVLRAAFVDAALIDNLANPYPCHTDGLSEVHTAEQRCLPEP